MNPASLKLDGWIPVHVSWPGGERDPWVEWCLFGETRLTEPFFEDTLARHMSHPFHHLFRRRTPVAALRQWRIQSPGAPVAGLIFHMSRCGSTLLARLLGSLEQNIVISEAPPVDALLRRGAFEIDEAERIEWVRGMASALGWRRSQRERRMFIKFDAWNVAELPLLARAFPDVPWIFLYRDPLEVLASHARSPGAWTVPGMLPPSVLGLEAEAAEWGWQEHRVRLLARVCELALQYRDVGQGSAGRGLFLNYSELPQAAWQSEPPEAAWQSELPEAAWQSELPEAAWQSEPPEAAWQVVAEHFGLEFSGEDLDQLRRTAGENSWTPAIPFERRPSASGALPPETRELAARWLEPLYQQMEALRAVAIA